MSNVASTLLICQWLGRFKNSFLKQLLLQDFLIYTLFTFSVNKVLIGFFTVNNKDIASYASHHLIVHVKEI